MRRIFRVRGFEIIDAKTKGKDKNEIKIPTRADDGSAGYDFYAPYSFNIPPGMSTLVMTQVKAYMPKNEFLQLHLRSSMGIKKGLVLTNTTGIVDSSYYNNPDNEGNIGIHITNVSNTAVSIKKGDRIAQGIFLEYRVADNDVVMEAERKGGMGSSGK